MSRRAAASVAIFAAIGLGLAGCQFVTPQATLKHYDASDGVSGSTGSVDIRNALIIVGSGDEASDGNLVFTAVNMGDDSAKLNVQVGDKDLTPITVAAGPNVQTEVGDGDDGQQLVSDLDAPAGSLVSVYFQAGDGEGVKLQVPVLNGEMAEYATLEPTPVATPTGTPTPTATPTGH